MARPTKFAHIVYRTRRFEQMVAWYEMVFEAKVQYRNPVLAFLTYDDEHHRFAFVNLSALGPRSPSTTRTRTAIASSSRSIASPRPLKPMPTCSGKPSPPTRSACNSIRKSW
jgi:catechol-2,3-dioxygenase